MRKGDEMIRKWRREMEQMRGVRKWRDRVEGNVEKWDSRGKGRIGERERTSCGGDFWALWPIW